MFKALSNPHRLALFNRLSTCCPPGTSCLEGLEIAPSTLSHHLKELNRAGLVQMQRRGKTVECWVDRAVLEELSDFFSTDS